MSNSNRSDQSTTQAGGGRSAHRWHPLGALLLALLLVTVPTIEAQVGKAQRAIEDLEGCSKQERSSGRCINILKRESAGKGKQRIKAQVRGGRIIWYEFDSKSGKARRAN